MRIKEWAAFAGAGILWGTSFIWIKVALEELTPIQLVAGRMLFGVIGLLVILWLTKQKLPRDYRTVRALFVASLMNPGVPFFLISWSETRIATGLASVLNGTVPLFATFIAHYALGNDERITLAKLAGLLSAFLGVVILVSRDLLAPSGNFETNIWGELAVLSASVIYGFSAVFVRKNLRHLKPVAQSTGVMLWSCVLYWALMLAADRPNALPHLGMTWVALVWLGLLGTCTAFLLYFYLLNAWGAGRASLVNYIFPIVGLVLGITFRGESADWRLLLGSAFIFGGILVANFQASLFKIMKSLKISIVD